MMIHTEELTKQYRGKGGCSGITLEVPEGSLFGLLGPNGAGKSTFVKMLVGLHRPDSGRGQVLGDPLGSVEARRKLGYLPELFRYHDWLSAEEVLAFHARLGGVKAAELRAAPWKARLRDKLAEVGLEEAGDKRVGGFSKGMQQRLGLACALLMEPALVILDEPASALDPVGRFEVRRILKELNRRGVTVFLNTHLLEDVEELCDQVAFLYGGRLQAAGPLQQLLNRDQGWRFLVGGWLPESMAALEAAAGRKLGLAAVQLGEDGTAELKASRLSREEAGWLHSLLHETGLTLYESGPVSAGLESWFIQAVAQQRERTVGPK